MKLTFEKSVPTSSHPHPTLRVCFSQKAASSSGIVFRKLCEWPLGSRTVTARVQGLPGLRPLCGSLCQQVTRRSIISRRMDGQLLKEGVLLVARALVVKVAGGGFRWRGGGGRETHTRTHTRAYSVGSSSKSSGLRV